jgi:hypothetical protein
LWPVHIRAQSDHFLACLQVPYIFSHGQLTKNRWIAQWEFFYMKPAMN